MAPGKQTQTSGPSSDRKTAGQSEQQGAQEAEQRPGAGALARQAQRTPRTLGARDLLQLQRAVGNRQIARMLAPAGRRPAAGDGPPIQRVTGLPVNAQVEVNNGGPTWYGQIVAVLDGAYRVRVGGMGKTDTVDVPEGQVGLHPAIGAFVAPKAVALAEEIIAASAAAPRASEMALVVEEWRSRKKPVHDPFLTLKAMKIGYAISVNAKIQDLLQTSVGIAIIQETFEELRRKTERQFIQFWVQKPAQVVADRGLAWSVFLDGVDALKADQQKLDHYFSEALEHDKGYAQIFAAVQMYFEIAMQQSGGPVEPFEEALARALNADVNTNIWVGGQQGGRISEQLGQGVNPNPGNKSWTPKVQEENMWTQIITNIVRDDFGYAATIAVNKQELFDRVRAIVPQTTDLHMEYLEDTLGFYGV